MCQQLSATFAVIHWKEPNHFRHMGNLRKMRRELERRGCVMVPGQAELCQRQVSRSGHGSVGIQFSREKCP
jgi:hypothetical protein